MIQWEKIALERGFLGNTAGGELQEGQVAAGNPKAMLIALYAEHKSIEGIANELMLSRHTVRVAFERFGVEVKSQGGPQNTKFEVTEDLLDEIERNGITSVARRLDLDYTTVYKRTKSALQTRRELREAPEQPATAPQDGKGTPHRDGNQ